jgi:hypothetical protein
VTPLLFHAVPGIDYRFPIPVWLYALAAGLAVLASLLVAAWRPGPLHERERSNFYPRLRRLRLGAIGLVVTSVLLVLAIVGGLFGAQEFFDNPITVLVWVDFWVGLGIVSALVGNVWDSISPISAAGRWLERRAAGAPPFQYPERLGLWPATLLLLVWTWLELVWDEAREPRTLAALAIAYIAVQLVGMAAFGTEAWISRCEVFTVVCGSIWHNEPFEILRGSRIGSVSACVE